MFLHIVSKRQKFQHLVLVILSIKICGSSLNFYESLNKQRWKNLSHFDKIDEFQAQIQNISLKHLLFNNHDVADNEGRKKQLPLEHFLDSTELLKKITEQLGLYITFETADLLDILYTTIGNNIEVNLNKSLLYIPIFIPNAQN